MTQRALADATKDWDPIAAGLTTNSVAGAAGGAAAAGVLVGSAALFGSEVGAAAGPAGILIGAAAGALFGAAAFLFSELFRDRSEEEFDHKHFLVWNRDRLLKIESRTPFQQAELDAMNKKIEEEGLADFDPAITRRDGESVDAFWKRFKAAQDRERDFSTHVENKEMEVKDEVSHWMAWDYQRLRENGATTVDERARFEAYRDYIASGHEIFTQPTRHRSESTEAYKARIGEWRAREQTFVEQYKDDSQPIENTGDIVEAAGIYQDPNAPIQSGVWMRFDPLVKRAPAPPQQPQEATTQPQPPAEEGEPDPMDQWFMFDPTVRHRATTAA